VIKDPQKIKGAILKHQRRRRLLKRGWGGRLLGNVRNIMVATVLCAASCLGSAVYSAHNSFVAADARPDVLEVFGGHSEVSYGFAKWGWWALEPVDINYGDDLRDEGHVHRLLTKIDVLKPRLVMVEYPCRYWNSLCALNYRSSQDKRRLEKLRRREMP
jgi:hypothetical protein